MQLDKSILLMVATVGTLALLGLMMFFPIPKDNAQIFLAVATFLLGYFFGSAINRTASPNAPAPQDGA